MSTLNPIQERSPTLVAATFPSREAATAAVDTLRDQQAYVIGPGDKEVARKLEPDQRGIWRTMLISHLVLGVAGAGLGLLAAYWLIASWPAAAGSPGFTMMFVPAMGAVFGMLVAGLVTLRPDHGRVIRRMQSALKQGRWVVVVRPTDAEHTEVAVSALRAAGAEPQRSL